MRLAILITNTDNSAFARERPDDGEKFTALIHEVRPDWTCVPFWVCREEFPEDIAAFDGAIITGSPASVGSGTRWIARMEALIHHMIDTRLPLFGACFGHQLIAKALGAPIVRNPQGWGHGLLAMRRAEPTPWAGGEQILNLYGSHIQQVGSVPDGARVVFESDACPAAGFAIGDSVFTVQHHPEMTHGFITDLVDHYAREVGPDVTTGARKSLAHKADRTAFALEIARFFEHAAQASAAER
jgi:GMP synthase-like glutamine amidotransferase